MKFVTPNFAACDLPKAEGLTKEERGPYCGHTNYRTVEPMDTSPGEVGTDARSGGGAAPSAHPLACRWPSAATLSVALAVDSTTANVVRIDLQCVDLKAQLAQTAWITGAERIFCN